MSASAYPSTQHLDDAQAASEGSFLVEGIPQNPAKARQQAKPKTTAEPTGAAVECGDKNTVAVLFARADSIYKRIPDCDVFDISRDARTYDGPLPIVAHPPCRGWGRLRKFAKVRPDERNLARLSVSLIRAFGGVLEHPEGSQLWADQSLPAPSQTDQYGGFTIAISQHWFGHRAEKMTLLYIVGIKPSELPPMPMLLGEATHVIAQHRTLKDGTRLVKGMKGWRPEVSKNEREHTPPQLAHWLCDIARKCRRL